MPVCRLYKKVENEEDFLVIEEWVTQEDADEHLRSDIFTVLMGAGILMRQLSEIVIHTVNHSTELEDRTPRTQGR